MPTISLTDRTIAGLKPRSQQADYFDRALPGFGVRVSPGGRKSFILLYRNTEKKLVRRTLGAYGQHEPEIGLAKARERARDELQKVSIGRDPRGERKQAKTQTFGALADLYIERHAKRRKRSWRDDARMIRQELADWKSRPAQSITRADVRELLETIVDRGAPVLANRVLALVRKVLNFGIDQEWVEANPAQRMARPSAETARSRVLTDDELRTLWKWLAEAPPKDADAMARRYFRLIRASLKLRLLTAQRGGEVINMRWADVDLDGGWWTIPGAMAKNGLPHRVPLTPIAVATLKGIRADSPGEGFIFTGVRAPSHRRGMLDGLEIPDVRPHDFRRTAASRMAGAGVPRLVVGKVLNHAEKGVTAVYDRHSYDAEKRTALETWAALLDAIVNPPKARNKVLRHRPRGRA